MAVEYLRQLEIVSHDTKMSIFNSIVKSVVQMQNIEYLSQIGSNYS